MSLWEALFGTLPDDVAYELAEVLSESDPSDCADDIAEAFWENPDLARRVMSPAVEDKAVRDALRPGYIYLELERAITALCPEEMGILLLESCAGMLADRAWEYTPLFRWRERVATFPAPLDVAAAVADGVVEGMRRARYFDASSKRDVPAPTPDTELPTDVCRVVAAAVVCERRGYRRDDLVTTGLQKTLHATVTRYPQAWRGALPWLIQILDPSRSELTDGTNLAIAADPSVLDELIAAGEHILPEIAIRARGLASIIDGRDCDGSISMHASALARHFDRSRRVFPRPLAEPSATWLSDLELEASLYNAVADATSDFANDFRDFAAAEEEGHLRSLMTRIETTLRDRRQIRAVESRLGSGGADLVGAFRPIPKKEEKFVGADLALVVTVDVPGRLILAFAEFVQVKKTLKPTGMAGGDKWSIKRPQLDDLLATSPTSAYWLLGADGDVFVVPAKLVHAVAAGTGVLSQLTFTVHYSEIRHAAISLAGYFTYLAAGTWTGSAQPETVNQARGSKGTRVRAVFELSVRYSHEPESW
ncbi:hypothetical protein V7968_32340 [Nocardia vulneris]|uniref:hypothetical protein n=1 Tax=Nocardia vulneris TaxID=1141657 RepID=UPI0030CCFF55